MLDLVATKERGFNVADAPSMDRKNTERRLDGWLVSREYNLA